MGLVFALQPDVRRSTPETLFVRSTKKKFGLGGSFLFGGALLATMFLAAAPLFRLFWTQGGFWDKVITVGVLTPIVLYPFLALLCWFYEEVVVVQKNPTQPGTFNLEAYEHVFGWKWNRRSLQGITLQDLLLSNWVGSKNVAALEAEEAGTTDRYGTRGHWKLLVRAPQGELLLIERRAKRDEIEFLKAQIQYHFEGNPGVDSPL